MNIPVNHSRGVRFLLSVRNNILGLSSVILRRVISLDVHNRGMSRPGGVVTDFDSANFAGRLAFVHWC